jgi:heme exporter protein B
MKNDYAASITTMVWKDLLSELRTKEMLSSMLVFSFMVVVLFNFAFPPGSEFLDAAVPGLLWMVFIFASLLGMNRAFVYEVDKGSLHGLMLCPVDRSSIFWGKLIVNLILIAIVELITIGFFVIFFDLQIMSTLLPLLVIVALSSYGLTVVGTLFSAMAVNTKSREVMLPILHFPVSVPIIIAAVESTASILGGASLAENWGWVRILLAFDIIYSVVNVLVFEYVLEE